MAKQTEKTMKTEAKRKKRLTVTYVEHSSFLVQWDDTAVLFDYYKGSLPDIDPEKYILFFVSHKHYDHYNEDIFSFYKEAKHRTYVISDDVTVSDTAVNEAKRNGDEVVFVGPHSRINAGEATVETLVSNDEGVAFLVKKDGVCLYHGGDLNYWYWYDESEQYNTYLTQTFLDETDRLKNVHIHAAFQAVDPRLEKNVYTGARILLEKAKVDHLFPMHLWGDTEAVEKLFFEEFIKKSGAALHSPYDKTVTIDIEI